MKSIRIIFLASLFLLCCHGATAQQQCDTLQNLDVRYYINCYWLDTMRPVYFSDPYSGADIVEYSLRYCQRVAYRFVPDQPLNIIGVAGAMTLQHLTATEFFQHLPDEIRDSVVANRRTEYFELYGTRIYDSVGNILQNTDSLVLLGSLSWTLMDSSRFITLPFFDPRYNYTDGNILTVPIIERYFQKPIRQDTTFYLGHTNFNNGYIHLISNQNSHVVYWVGTSAYYYTNPPMGITTRQAWNTLTFDTCTMTNNSGFAPPTILFQEYTENGDHYKPWRHVLPDGIPIQRSTNMPFLFPIVDTTGMFLPEKPDSLVCDTVEGFRVLDQRGNMTAFAWTDDNRPDVWQLSWGEEGIAPEDGTLAYATTNVKSVVGLQDSVVYTAFVRARCNDTLFSEWSVPLRFWKGMNDTVSLLPHNTVEQLTYLYPNPAENSVTVACSFAMSLVELFALDGTKLISQPANGIITQIDLSALPNGTYMLRITTPAGTAIKKLVRR